ncbi:MAG TPA: hypothetical protein ENJ80_11215 [Gammaproteobacteria bacterium]|nr:hypothetical protein [Gammaproteobacteria bacterium]
MIFKTRQLECAFSPYTECDNSTLWGDCHFKTPRFTGKISYFMDVAEYRKFVIKPLQALADSFGTTRREQIGNLHGNFFIDFNLRPDGKVLCRYELSNDDRFNPEASTVFRGTFTTDHLHIGMWLTQAREDLRAWKAPPDWWKLINGDDISEIIKNG